MCVAHIHYMDKSDFVNPLGQIKTIKTKEKVYEIFIPELLPVTIEYDSKIIKKIERANNLLGNLSGLIKNLPNPDLFIKPYIKKEAVLSSKIEGTRTSLSDLFKSDLDNKQTEDLKEVQNYLSALDFGINKIKDDKIDLPLILNLNKILLTEVRGHNKEPGRIRILQNWIGESDKSIEESTYTPPNPESVLELLENLTEYINNYLDTPDVVKSAIIHYQFEAIHPFCDGNGRVGRLLIILYLCKTKLLDVPVLPISEYFEQRKPKYYELLLNVSKKSELNNWIDFYLTAVIDQTQETITKLNKLLEYRKQKISYLKDNKVNAKVLTLFDQLFVNPYINVNLAKKIITVNNYNTTNRIIQKLVGLKLLKEIKKGTYLAEDIEKMID